MKFGTAYNRPSASAPKTASFFHKANDSMMTVLFSYEEGWLVIFLPSNNPPGFFHHSQQALVHSSFVARQQSLNASHLRVHLLQFPLRPYPVLQQILSQCR